MRASRDQCKCTAGQTPARPLSEVLSLTPWSTKRAARMKIPALRALRCVSPAKPVGDGRPRERAEHDGEAPDNRVEAKELPQKMRQRQPRHVHAIGSPRSADPRAAAHCHEPPDRLNVRERGRDRCGQTGDLQIERRVEDVPRPEAIYSPAGECCAERGAENRHDRQAVCLRVGEAHLKPGEDRVEEEYRVNRVGIEEPADQKPDDTGAARGLSPCVDHDPRRCEHGREPAGQPLLRPLPDPEERRKREQQERHREHPKDSSISKARQQERADPERKR